MEFRQTHLIFVISPCKCQVQCINDYIQYIEPKNCKLIVIFLISKLLTSQILRKRNLLCQSNAPLAARSYFFELKMHLGNTLRNLLQSCNKKYTFFQTRWLLPLLPFHVLGKVQKQEQKTGISANSSLTLRDFTLQVSGIMYCCL
jgi:hypothetical protein